MALRLMRNTTFLLCLLIVLDRVVLTVKPVSQRENDLIARQWKILGTKYFTTKRYGLGKREGRIAALMHLFHRSKSSVERAVMDLQLTDTLSSTEPAEAADVPEAELAEAEADRTLDFVVGQSTDVAKVNGRFLVNPAQYELVRDVIHTMYSEGRPISLRSLAAPLAEKLGFPVSKPTLYRTLRFMGFKWRHRHTKHLFIDPKLGILRGRYLRAIRHFRAEDYLIAYLDETWLHSYYRHKKQWIELDVARSSHGPLNIQCQQCGAEHPAGSGSRLVILDVVTEYGFPEGADLVYQADSKLADYHGNFDHLKYEQFVEQKVVPALKQMRIDKGKKGIVLVIDNAPYHSRLLPQLKRPPQRKADIQQWLRGHNIAFDDKDRVVDLTEKVRQFFSTFRGNKYYMDEHLQKTHGIETVRTPPYHCDLSPIEKCWAFRKHWVADRNNQNRRATMGELTQLWKESRSELSLETIKKTFDRVLKIEDQFWKIDHMDDEDVETEFDVAERNDLITPFDVDDVDVNNPDAMMD